jgi:hypothetical protein
MADNGCHPTAFYVVVPTRPVQWENTDTATRRSPSRHKGATPTAILPR